MSKKKTGAHEVLAFVIDPDSQKVLESVEWSEFDAHLTLKQGNIHDATAYLAHEKAPRYLIVDLTGSELPVSDMTALAEVCDPNVGVIAVGERNDVGLFRDLLELGVRDYIAKPLLVGIIKRCFEGIDRSPSPGAITKGFTGRGQTFLFLGSAGGVGTSTFAANTAWILSHQMQKKTTLVDFSLRFPAVTQFFDIRPPLGLGDMLYNPKRIDDIFLKRSLVQESKFLSILGSSDPVDQQEAILPASLKSITDILKASQQYIVYDMFKNNPVFFTKPFLTEMNVVVFIADPTIYSVRNMAKLINYFKGLRIQGQKIMIILNRMDCYKEGEVSLETFEKAINQSVDLIVDFDRKKILESLNEGAPLASQKGYFSDQIQRFVKVLLGQESSRSQSSQKSFFSNLFKS